MALDAYTSHAYLADESGALGKSNIAAYLGQQTGFDKATYQQDYPLGFSGARHHRSDPRWEVGTRNAHVLRMGGS